MRPCLPSVVRHLTRMVKLLLCAERRSYQRQQCAEGYAGNLCANCARAQDGARYGFYTAFTCTRCKSNATLVRVGWVV